MNQIFPKMITPSSMYWESFKVLYKDFEESCRYVQPHPDHFEVYSLRYYELLLRACTEFESLCKQQLVERKLSRKNSDDFNITDYHLLGKSLDIVEYAVGYNFHPIYFTTPLETWKIDHKLPWYQDYNQVKHNRVTEFKRANLRNVLNAIGALFIIITQLELCPRGSPVWFKDGMVYTVDGLPIMRKSLKDSNSHNRDLK